MILDIKFDYSLLKNKIRECYPSKTENQSMVQYCRAIKMQTYRLKKIFENKAYFTNRDEYFSCLVLNIKEEEKSQYFEKVLSIE